MSSTQAGAHVVVVNPLGSALDHYTRALVHDLAAVGVSTRVVSVAEPSADGRSAASWVARYVVALARARRGAPAEVVVTWPVLGYLDLPLARFVLGRRVRASITLHDPRPLVRAVGYGRAVRRLVRPVTGRVRFVVHSEAAKRHVSDDARVDVPVVPHPVLPAAAGDGAGGPGTGDPAPSTPADAQGAPTVRVLGQYKRDRDVALLEALAERLGERASLEIHGRGWPGVTGWRVVEGFVDESRLDALIEGSDCVLVPYRRFYQSGIAVRALELGTPFVGPEASSLAEFGPEVSCLVDEPEGDDDARVQAWCEAVRRAVRKPQCDPGVAERVAVVAGRRWRAALRL